MVAIAIGVYAALPRLAGLDETWQRLSEGDPRWLALAALLEAGSYAGYVLAFRRVFVQPASPLGWTESYDITMAGVAATRLLATAGAGGIALTGWALSRSGLGRTELVRGMTTFYVTLYGLFMIALLVVGLGLGTGLFAGSAPFGLTVVPAAFAAAVIAVALLTALLPRDLPGRARTRVAGDGRAACWTAMLARAPPGSPAVSGARSDCCAGATLRW